LSSEPDGQVPVESWDPSTPDSRTPEAWLQWANGMPISRALNLVITEIGEGRLVGEVKTSVLPLNPNGSLHGGTQLAIADHCMGLVAIPAIDPGFVVVSAGVHASFHRPAMPPLTIRGRLLSAGKTLAQTEIELYDERNRLCTSAYGTMAVLSLEVATRNAATER
jgi:uncharacterized protein (TIGR00369 family)